MIIERRKFLIGLIAAPFVVRSGILMPVKQLIRPAPIVLTPGGTAVLEYSSDGINWIAGPIIDLEIPGIKTSHGLHRFWRARVLSDANFTIEIPSMPFTNVAA